jgi:hypothetical protein
LRLRGHEQSAATPPARQRSKIVEPFSMESPHVSFRRGELSISLGVS